MKTLILSCNTGEGHNSAARAIHEEMLDSGEESVFMDTLAFGKMKISSIVASSYSSIVTKRPNVFGIAYKVSDRYNNKITSPVYFANTLYTKNMYEYILENQFDAIIPTHLFAMESLTHIRRKYQLDAKGYGILTDYTCIPFLTETDLDGYFIPHQDLLQECVDKGMPKGKLIFSGIPVFKKFANRLQKPEARNHLVIPQNKHMYMIMTGGIGCGDVLKLCGEILKDDDPDIAVYVLSGRNDRLKDDVDQRNRLDPRIQSVVFTENVNIYMNATDVLLSKPGGISSTEAAVANAPLVHTMAIPGCETKNAGFFARLGMSLNAETTEDAIRFANLLIRDNERAEQMRARQRAEINPYAAKDIVAYVREHL